MGEVTFITALGVALMTLYLMKSFSVEGINAGHRLIVFVICICVGAYFLAVVLDTVQTGEISCRSSRGNYKTCYRKDGIFSFLLGQAHFLLFAITSFSVATFLLLKRK